MLEQSSGVRTKTTTLQEVAPPLPFLCDSTLTQLHLSDVVLVQRTDAAAVSLPNSSLCFSLCQTISYIEYVTLSEIWLKIH